MRGAVCWRPEGARSDGVQTGEAARRGGGAVAAAAAVVAAVAAGWVDDVRGPTNRSEEAPAGALFSSSKSLLPST